MSVKLRLMRFGKRNRPCYRVCAIDTRAPRDGAYIESIGVYDPFIDDDRKKVRIDKERAEHWLSVGAQPSQTVASFCRMNNVEGVSKPRKARKKRAKPASVKARAKAKAEKAKAANRKPRTRSVNKKRPEKKED